MSFSTTITLWCDFCPNWIYLDVVKGKRKFTDEGIKLGWAMSNNKHICPDCLKKGVR